MNSVLKKCSCGGDGWGGLITATARCSLEENSTGTKLLEFPTTVKTLLYQMMLNVYTNIFTTLKCRKQCLWPSSVFQ